MSSSCSYFQPLPIHQLEGIYRGIRESDYARSLIDDVRSLAEWLKTQPHLSHIEISQSYLMSTLLQQKNPEKAKKHVDFHYTARAVHPEFFISWDPCATQFKNIYSSYYAIPSKVLTPDGSVIWLIGHNNLHEVSAHDIFVESTMFTTYLRYHSPYASTILIFDCKKITSQIIQAYFSCIPKIKMNSTRMSKIYVLYPFPMLATIISLLKGIPILKKKMGDRMEIWNRDANELADVLPAQCLPRDYGGSCPSLDEQKDQFYEFVSQRRDWFMTECQKKARLDLRPRTVDNEDNLLGFGVEGTFRKLSVD